MTSTSSKQPVAVAVAVATIISDSEDSDGDVTPAPPPPPKRLGGGAPGKSSSPPTASTSLVNTRSNAHTNPITAQSLAQKQNQPPQTYDYYLHPQKPETIPLQHLIPQCSLFKLYNLPSITFVSSQFIPATALNTTRTTKLREPTSQVQPKHYKHEPSLFHPVAQQAPHYIIYSPSMRETLVNHLAHELNMTIYRAETIADFYITYEGSHAPNRAPNRAQNKKNPDFNPESPKASIASKIDRYDALTRQVHVFGLDPRTIPTSSSLQDIVANVLHPRYYGRFLQALRTYFKPLPTPVDYFQILGDLLTGRQTLPTESSPYYYHFVPPSPSPPSIAGVPPQSPPIVKQPYRLNLSETILATGQSLQSRIFDVSYRIQMVAYDSFSPGLALSSPLRVALYSRTDLITQLELVTKPRISQKIRIGRPLPFPLITHQPPNADKGKSNGNNNTTTNNSKLTNPSTSHFHNLTNSKTINSSHGINDQPRTGILVSTISNLYSDPTGTR
jgi:hypothetical protein